MRRAVVATALLLTAAHVWADKYGLDELAQDVGTPRSGWSWWLGLAWLAFVIWWFSRRD